MRFAKSLFAAIAAGGLLVGTLAGPAAAHKVTIDQVHISDFGEGGINTQVWLSKEDHPGTVKITLKKKVDGAWKAIATKKATYQVGWGYTYTFDPVPGKKKCKAVGVFKANNHPTRTGTSKVINC